MFVMFGRKRVRYEIKEDLQQKTLDDLDDTVSKVVPPTHRNRTTGRSVCLR